MTSAPRGVLRLKEKTPWPDMPYLWEVLVVQDNVILWADNSTNWRTLCIELEETLATFRHMHWLGQSFRPWTEIVDEAADDL